MGVGYLVAVFAALILWDARQLWETWQLILMCTMGIFVNLLLDMAITPRKDEGLEKAFMAYIGLGCLLFGPGAILLSWLYRCTACAMGASGLPEVWPVAVL